MRLFSVFSTSATLNPFHFDWLSLPSLPVRKPSEMLHIRNCSRLLDLMATCCSSSWRPALTSLPRRDTSDGTPPILENVQLFPVQIGSLRGPRQQVQRATHGGAFRDIMHPPPSQICMVGGEKVVVFAGCTLVASCFSLEVGWTCRGEFSCCCWVRQYYSPLATTQAPEGWE